MKTIAYLMPSFPVLSETFVGNEIRAMQAQGHHIVPFAFERNEGIAQPIDLMLADQLQLLIEAPVAKTLWQLSASPSRLQFAMQFVNQQQGLPKRSLLWYGARLAALVEKHGCQHIHAHFGLASAATAIVAARLAGVTVSFTCHGYDVYRAPADLPLKLRAANFVVAVSDEMKRDMLAMAPQANIKRIRCGVDLAQFKSTVHNPFNQKRLLYLGRLSETKGVDRLLHALANIPARDRPKLDIVGDGPLRLPLLKKMIALDLIGYVYFVGAKSSTWLCNNYQRYTALVAPFIVTETGVRDTGPLVIKEAMALHLPIITTNIEACREMLCDAQGQFIPVGAMVEFGNHFALSAAIRSLLNQSPQVLRAMGDTGHEHLLANFQISTQAAQLSQAIASCQQEVHHVANADY
ncbi:Glycosyltransferase involved in cell wall bisynthesis [Oceanospirillum multiglobuliferum]|uniref:Colanic acid biosynthesis glycosyltransferase WcaL n=1 Tax=Oceanospirillum multiglobuliferum TaxID=64969 RepID=A0A1T4PDK7_9GAMM|nr:glycosyltransferase family 4 protein [Oceanospirillum multiglobuliferum]OPX55593.1 hypothetical protein BTE48_08235 [Oceanospirillum multiglobuliferum]SJZ89653.1 Glycosyltransferase involved in cell wall bisynthesis [Oceanospirillum multiglobuliferum]